MLNKWLVCSVLLVLKPVHLLKKEKQAAKQPAGYIPCEKDWFLFGDKCYRTFGIKAGKLSWEKASKHCDDHEGHLATIQSKEVQEFLLIFLLLEDETRVWIGLNDRQNETKYVWDGGNEYNYSNWSPFEPTEWKNDKEDCVEMVYQEKGEPGGWNDQDCSTELAYICQVSIGKEKSLEPTLCPTATGGGWKYGSSCYNIVKENKTWEDAERHCHKKFKGNLVKILSSKADFFLRYILADFSTDIWIGIKLKEQFQQQFSSGWYVAYTNWRKNPRNFVDGTCVIRTKEKTWEIVPCTAKHPFICEVSNVSPPVLNKPLEGSKCPEVPEDWRDFGGEFCYFIDTTNSFNWYRANFECIRRGGSLASIHSKAELDTLAPFVKASQSGKWRYFIGHYRPVAAESAFEWADGSEMDYTNWNDDEPNNKNEKCGEMWATNMKWNDVDCEETNGYICSVRKIPPDIKKKEAHSSCINGITYKSLIGVTVCILLVVILLSVVIYYFGPWKEENRKKSTVTTIPLQPPVSPSVQRYRSSCDQITCQTIVNDIDEEHGIIN